MADAKAIEDKWRSRWQKDKAFEADAGPARKKKFFLTFPYPYMNGFLHVGHFYSLTRVDVFARYKRLCGYNVLFPQGWHCTGSPIENAATRIKEGEPKQIESMKNMGFGDEEIAKFAEPEHWTEYFPKETKADYERMGMSVDFRRSFITTSLNPYYDAFIRWQMRKLKARGYISRGKHPVVWDPKRNMPVGDHDRIEGEGEVPQEFLLVRHRLDDGRFVISATLRQDTILGITNLYVHPDVEYAEIKIQTDRGDEIWILGNDAVKRLEEQGRKLERAGSVKGTGLIGKEAEEFGDHKVLILPATFLDPKFGTGLVHSVPSDSADDLIALQDLQKDNATIRKYGLDPKRVKAIRPIEILDTEGIGGNPAQYFLDKHNVRNQNERKKLDAIRKELYKLSFYSARFGKCYRGVFPKDISGKPVQDEKDYVKEQLMKQGWIESYWQLTGRVVSRSLTECIVRIVSDQWFITYGSEAWKKQVRNALKKVRLYPEKSRPQFEYVVGWLQDWACTREFGLGTRLPWDEKWIIESLSDSTIYMAFYTIAHLLQQVPEEKLSDELFDYVFLGKGNDGNNSNDSRRPDILNIDEMRREFLYWYPLDMRSSGKDLIQNHLTFFLFNHCAIFPEEHWPKGIAVNGWVTVDGEKMSKSRGNVIPMRKLHEQYGADTARLTMMFGGEGLDDANWDSELSKSQVKRLAAWFAFCRDNYQKSAKQQKPSYTNLSYIDEWLLSKLHGTIRDATSAMEATLFRTALQHIYFDLNRAVRWYLKRAGRKANRAVLSEVIAAQVAMMHPFTPFYSGEAWESIIASDAGKRMKRMEWPKADKKLIRDRYNATEEIIQQAVEDIGVVQKLAKIEKPMSIKIIVAKGWKRRLLEKMLSMREKLIDQRQQGAVLKDIMQDSALKRYGRDISKMLPAMMRPERVQRLPGIVLAEDEEVRLLDDARNFLKEQFNTDIIVEKEEASREQKAGNAMPGKPAIVMG